MALKVIILAAGKGTRMRSRLPKVLQSLAGRPLLAHVVDRAHAIHADEIVTVIGHGSDQVRQTFETAGVRFCEQSEQLGTGHAVQQAVDHLDDADTVLVLYGDVPLTAPETLKDLISLVGSAHPLALLSMTLEEPDGYGRIVRNAHHQVEAIVEQKDASTEQLAIREINTGMLAARGAELKKWLGALDADNAQGEYYLTDIVSMAVADGFEIATTEPERLSEVLGVNNKSQLQTLERLYQREQAERLMAQGVTLSDASRLDIRGQLEVGQDVSLDANVVIEGAVHLGDEVVVEPHCVLKDCRIEAGTRIAAFSHIEGASVGPDCTVGPYARLRPGTVLQQGAKIGNFVETKNARIGDGSKINHLSYIGDTTMGAHVNIGAGTITCNYDGVNKHRTDIGDEVFVGSATQLVAPVKVGSGATIGAGSTITKDVPGDTLTLSRSRQTSLKSWQGPQKKDIDPQT
ncbi:bifunctional UDP-N-acetylglucosamine diphosphorylase/glucosamine-1-phosphate N-acetyltransferase GlmU [Thiomicrospira sp. WB1]|uniref:bifunctional UDP-N-acetylglucosamine diphosphorylase/glucosamine-1-phosphate N-acetyltransferase GlmU n=1 Tax=Thiomicrospira sp. WB1 TaxID=1685380 RepID=UPI00074AABBE|nr:bifunctional UDP-N-acetylglucosamine diphosphorylase/glucosamine-1-phosphate N-acetyltransferase GlmU [Thiomicrospira sp. WB1]KUJ72393.1 bifunctional N-acetylglucosamine-1-phosphate uridyltransferase/glucosamine-1-phosphate acetyltransferase [Thiomicrospira sp. WB1]